MIFRCKCYHSVLLVIVAVQMFICLLTFLITPPGWESSNLQAGEIGSIERIHVMLVMCVEHENGTMNEEEYKDNFLQVHSLLKTLAIFSSRPVTVHLDPGVSGNSRFPQFPEKPQISLPFRLEKFISLPFPKSGNAISNIPFRSREKKFSAGN